jgi:3D domain-containing protein
MRSQSTFGPNATACERGNWGSLSSRPTRHSSCTHDHATFQFHNMVRTIESAFLCRTSGKDRLLSLRSVLSSVCFLTVLDDATFARAQVFTCDPVHTATSPARHVGVGTVGPMRFVPAVVAPKLLMPFLIEAQLPIEGRKPASPFRRLMIAQDTGTAIVGPARADLYWGGGRGGQPHRRSHPPSRPFCHVAPARGRHCRGRPWGTCLCRDRRSLGPRS